MKHQALSVLLVTAALGALPAACGKKGPPLPPFVRLPAAVDGFSARRIGSTVYVQFKIPAKNQDNSTPADVARVDVYGLTGAAEDPGDVVKYGTLVGTVLVRRPPSPDEEDRAREKKPTGREAGDKQKEEPKPTPASRPREAEPGFDQGAEVTLTETLTPAVVAPAPLGRQERDKKKTQAERSEPILLPSASGVPVPSRVYVAVGVSFKGRRGSYSREAAIPLLDLPAAPGAVKVSHSETAITIQWAPPPGAPWPAVATVRRNAAAAAAPPSAAPAPASEPGAVQAEAPAADLPPLPSTPRPSRGAPDWSYQVYEVPPPGRTSAAAAPAQPGASMPPVAAPEPVNSRPLTATTFTDSRIEFGTERCYVVRAVKAIGPLSEEGEPSEVACITPRDIYPPAAPKGLTAVVNAGAVSLIWDPNAEADLDGYLVLRGEAPNGTLQPITREPIHETTFNDTSVKAGVRYTYAIVAVDKVGNASAPSARLEETAR